MSRPPLDLAAIQERYQAASVYRLTGYRANSILRCLEDIPALLAEIASLRSAQQEREAILEAINCVLHDEPVSEFMLSFEPVHQVDFLMRKLATSRPGEPA